MRLLDGSKITPLWYNVKTICIVTITIWFQPIVLCKSQHLIR